MDEFKNYIAGLREDFTKGTLNENDIKSEPSAQFDLWMQQAIESKVLEAHAMHLSTISPQGKPSGRIVYLREFETNSFWFYTNYDSRKSLELLKNPFASLTFFWPELERQIRIEGHVEKASEKYSDAYFNARPYESKLGAWASNQSHKLNGRADLEKRLEELRKNTSEQTIQRPPFWGGFVLKANYYEFWQGRKSRLHDRISYELTDLNWVSSRLAP